MATEASVSVSELQTQLGRYLEIVRKGGTVIITEHGEPVGEMRPPAPSAEALRERFRMLAEAGLISWDGTDPGPHEPTVQVHGEGTIADLLVESRE